MNEYMLRIIAQNREPSLEELTVMYSLFQDKSEKEIGSNTGSPKNSLNQKKNSNN